MSDLAALIAAFVTMLVGAGAAIVFGLHAIRDRHCAKGRRNG